MAAKRLAEQRADAMKNIGGARPKDKVERPAVFVSVTQDEREEIMRAVTFDGGHRSVSSWARAVLLREARRINRKAEG